MSQNLISASLATEDAAAIQQNLQEIKTKLGFLLSLQTEDVVTLFKPGNSYLPFIEKAYETANAHPEIMPGVFNAQQFTMDYNLLNALRPIFTQISELEEGVRRTYIAAGSDAMVAALEVYNAVKQNKDKVPGLSATADEMAVFFAKKPKVKATEQK